MTAPADSLHVLLAGLLRYPGPQGPQDLSERAESAARRLPGAAAELRKFAAHVGAMTPGELQEEFVRTFEHSAERALETGWHVHGESYSRGTCLAVLRGLLRAHGLPENGELPDHIGLVLPLLERLEPDAAREWCRRLAGPATLRIREGLERIGSPWVAVPSAAIELLERHAPRSAWEEPVPESGAACGGEP